MADIKTNLRELSVGFSFYNTKRIDEIKPVFFFDICSYSIKGFSGIQLAKICENELNFNSKELNIIKNSIKLGKIIKSKFGFENPTIEWVGSQTQKVSPIDIYIGGVGFSLKESSRVLYNMGLSHFFYKVSGLKKYKKMTLHCFSDFANGEFDLWFKETRNLIISYLKNRPFVYKEDYISSLRLKNDDLYVEYKKGNDLESSIVSNFTNCDYDRFNKTLSGTLKKKVFSKIIKLEIMNNISYQEAKRNCALNASKKIVNELNKFCRQSTTPPTLYDLFRIDNDPYFYAKVTDKSVQIFEVPTISQLENKLIIENFNYSIPKSQINILTTICNRNNNQSITFRNEARYSHGQFNGTPEFKMYINDFPSNDLHKIYDQI